MIPVPSGMRVWLAVGRTDMRRGMNGGVQETLGRDPFAGDLFVFRGARGDLIKILWHDGLGMSLYAKRLERGRFIWPSATGGSVTISAARLSLHARLPMLMPLLVRLTDSKIEMADIVIAQSANRLDDAGRVREQMRAAGLAIDQKAPFLI